MAQCQVAKEGKSLLEALKDKYDREEEEDNKFGFVIFVSKGSAGTNQDFFIPTDVYLNDCSINQIGDSNEIKRLCGDVQELHLHDNLFDSLNTLITIPGLMSNLTVLNISNNALAKQEFDFTNTTSFPKLVKLIANGTNLSWKSVLNLLELYPNLQELHVCFNKYDKVDILETNKFERMKIINIGGNSISSWCDIRRIGAMFPNLDSIFMLDNPLSDMPENNEDVGKNLENLSQLYMKDCMIDSWISLEKFKHLPNLKRIKMIGKIPLFKDMKDEDRVQMILAYLPSITYLNGGRIGEEEKEHAERAFIRKFMDSDEKPDRYFELESKHGKLDPLVEVNLQKKETANILLAIEEKKPVLHSVNLNLTLQQFSKSIVSLVGTPHFYLYMDQKDLWTGSEKMTFPTRTLLRYGLKDGDQILVVKKNK